MVAAEGKIEAEEEVEIVDLDGADAEVEGGELEEQRVELESLLDVGGVDVAGVESAGF